ncbi:hypothetical protein [Pleionea sp. CnH1-48]|uniref:hypothetical protein n=1 Tax=Pleionea sp. CnH1-48 TaxID=2954494 RepID=UPI002098091F|nr:hypothetical protein [Pleionea sp. CnH1-48]MCO7223242.1 hypothetical protein [Pleionea sp. CnH1-48]
MKYIYTVILFVVSGCATVNWHGFLPSKQYKVRFTTSNDKPVSGVMGACHGNGIWPSDEMAKEINARVKPSEIDGMITLSHSGYHHGGSYNQLGSITWGHSKSGEVFCSFTYNGTIVVTDNITSFNQLKTVVIN